MATIKDIAQAVGVSHATVSNVLNHKGNVSAQKVKLVMDAANALGYHVNEAASALRSGGTRTIAVILPDSRSSAYSDLYQSLAQAAAEKGYGTLLCLTNNNPGSEHKAIAEVVSSRARYALVVTSLPDPQRRYAPLRQAGVRLLFALRGAPEGFRHAGFDMAQAARALAGRMLSDGAARVGLMTNMTLYPAEAAFEDAFLAAMRQENIPVARVQSIASQYMRQAFTLLGSAQPPDAVAATCEEMARAVRSVANYLGLAPRIYTLAPARLAESEDYVCYRLNYRRLGRDVVQALTGDAPLADLSGDAPGFVPRVAFARRPAVHLTMLSVDTPAARALSRLLPRLERNTGVSLSLTLRSTQEINGVYEAPETLRGFDLFRMDMARMSRWARALFLPLEETDFGLSECFSRMLPELAAEYSLADGAHYALPFDPGCCLLFFREDLLEDPHLQREFFEQCHRPLCVPRTRKEYLEIAVFMAQAGARASSAWHGAIITRRASEYVADLLSLCPGGGWPKLTGEVMDAFIQRRRTLESCASVVTDGSWNHAVARFAQGESALMIAHGNYAGRLAEEPLSRVSGRVGYAAAPDAQPLMGGGVLGIVKDSPHAAEAAEALAWLYSPETARLLALLGGCSPFTGVYECEEITDVYPWLGAVRRGLSGGIRRKIFAGVGPDFDQLAAEKEIARLCEAALHGAISPETAAESINAVIPK